MLDILLELVAVTLIILNLLSSSYSQNNIRRENIREKLEICSSKTSKFPSSQTHEFVTTLGDVIDSEHYERYVEKKHDRKYPTFFLQREM